MEKRYSSIIDNIDEPPLVTSLKSLHEAGKLYLSEKDTWPEGLVESFSETEFIGSGSQFIVIVDPSDNKKVIAFKYSESGLESKLELLEKYHMHNVLNILFPEYFPKVYTSSQRTGQVRKARVFPDKDLMKSYSKLRYEEYQRLYRKIEADIYSKSGISVDLDDYEKGNLIYDTSGNLKYIDLIRNSIGEFDYDLDRVLDYFTKINGSESDKRRLIRSLRRIRELDIINEYRTYRRINNSKWEKLSAKQQAGLKHVLNIL